MPHMTPVKSSNIKAIGYDDETGAMHVTFKSGDTYAYAGVEKAIYLQAFDAASVGRFVASDVVAKFKARKLERQTSLALGAEGQ
ncbi:MAG: KTSC domain-containing protein [Bradyrhizobium sp.]|nr:KTSC domain-containing protein [Bradyrhizobium sp.]